MAERTTRPYNGPMLPEVIGICPVHRDEFYVPHDGMCPEQGCDQQLVMYMPSAEAEVERLREEYGRVDRALTQRNIEAERLREALSLCVDRLVYGPLPGNDGWWDAVQRTRP